MTDLGRPTKYKKEYAGIAYELGLLGATDKQIADAFDVNVDTVYDWRKKHPQFSESLRLSKIIADGKVARALYKRALGFEYDETTLEDGVKTKVVKKQVAPDTGAITLWLKNRQKELWRDKQVVEFENMSDEQLDKVIADLKNTIINGQKSKDWIA